MIEVQADLLTAGGFPIIADEIAERYVGLSYPDMMSGLELTGLAHHFDPAHLFSATTVSNGKPAPDLSLHAAETLGVWPSSCLVIEDSPSGVAAARQPGCRWSGSSVVVTPDRRRVGSSPTRARRWSSTAPKCSRFRFEKEGRVAGTVGSDVAPSPHPR